MVSTNVQRSACRGCPEGWTPCVVVRTIADVDERWGREMGRFYDLIQQHMDEQPYPVSERQVARALGVTASTLTNWRSPRQLPERRHIEAVAELVGVTYARALDAVMDDIGYLPAKRSSASA